MTAADPELTRLRPPDDEGARLRFAEGECEAVNARCGLDFTARRRDAGFDFFGWLGAVCEAARAVGAITGVAVVVEIHPAGVLRMAPAPGAGGA